VLGGEGLWLILQYWEVLAVAGGLNRAGRVTLFPQRKGRKPPGLCIETKETLVSIYYVQSNCGHRSKFVHVIRKGIKGLILRFPLCGNLAIKGTVVARPDNGSYAYRSVC